MKHMREETSFSGGVFSDSIDGGRSGVTIELAHDGSQRSPNQANAFLI